MEMKRLFAVAAVVVMTGLLIGCGGDTKSDGDDSQSRDREPYPFVKTKLKNTGAEDAPPAIVTAKGKVSGAPSQTHKVGPVAPGAEQTTGTRGTDAADELEIVVKFAPGAVLTGSDSYPGSKVKSVEVEANEAGGTATVKFHSGQPDKTIPLTP